MPWINRIKAHECVLPDAVEIGHLGQADEGSTYECDGGCSQVWELFFSQRNGWGWRKCGDPYPLRRPQGGPP